MKQLRHAIMTSAAVLLLAGSAGAQGAKPLTSCPTDAVASGAVCMDTYEASVWRLPNVAAGNKSLVAKIQKGKATLADLTAAGAMQLGNTNDDYAPCADNAQNCTDDIYALSLPGVSPSVSMTWFQAQAACENSRKRLPSNAEWQLAVAGTPDAGPDDGATDCNTAGFSSVPTGSRSNCRSARGIFDMVGNVYEWVADWVPRSSTCGAWSPGFSPPGYEDHQCLAGAATVGEPGALMRGGSWGFAEASGPFSILGSASPTNTFPNVGFRCAR